MALAPVTLHESLRPWRSAGLLHILLDVPVEDDKRGLPPSDTVPAKRDGAPAASPTPGWGTMTLVAVAGCPISTDQGTANVRRGDVGSAAPLCLATNPAPLSQPQEWTEPWQAAFAKTRHAPLVWSYHELGLDLAGVGSPERGHFFRKLITELGFSGAIFTFWPTAVLTCDGADDEPVLRPDASVYHAGLKLLSARAVVLFGQQSLNDSEYGALPLFEQRVDAGRLILHVPGLGQLLADPKQVRVTISFLQAALGFFLYY